ncbi:RAD9, HUS1, RAD1-interacting nuclear orphan protein 1 [Solea senegalensis]|uniref:RAD9, HUS1, RAD1-interacting nuclear orphan protein 1 n=1 Tax=Solea senegalensis TaxID=28829 RepID=A0AAV6QVZ3_SOLSE|nr:RAD9, HUS1, RAD1-interacting nuclear orphan protein 1 [Solea senegalensis]KAG7497636.1 RAD9, HUS1, RAD1-interacting nuclear orphan protein 1 [Solea senegalensis]
MPRKASKTEKPPLLFLERPLGGARLQKGPEVRTAVNPKDFFTETQAHSSSALHSWVSPQFDTSAAAALPVRRGRRKCQSTTSILDRSSQLSRKSSVCKFPSLSFQARSRDQSLKTRTARTKKTTATASAAVSGAGNQPRGSRQLKKPVSCAQIIDTPKRQSASVRRRDEEKSSVSSRRCCDQPKTSSLQGERSGLLSDGASTPVSTEFSSVCLPPDVDTPELMQDGRSHPSSPTLHLLIAQPCNQQSDILVADSPERDYGLKVTWRRRRSLMLLLKEQGHLSDSDVLVHSLMDN